MPFARNCGLRSPMTSINPTRKSNGSQYDQSIRCRYPQLYCPSMWLKYQGMKLVDFLGHNSEGGV